MEGKNENENDEKESGGAPELAVLLGLGGDVEVDEVDGLVEVLEPVDVVLAQHALSLLVLAHLQDERLKARTQLQRLDVDDLDLRTPLLCIAVRVARVACVVRVVSCVCHVVRF
jgi:hypothetical protein